MTCSSINKINSYYCSYEINCIYNKTNETTKLDKKGSRFHLKINKSLNNIFKRMEK